MLTQKTLLSVILSSTLLLGFNISADCPSPDQIKIVNDHFQVKDDITGITWQDKDTTHGLKGPFGFWKVVGYPADPQAKGPSKMVINYAECGYTVGSTIILLTPDLLGESFSINNASQSWNDMGAIWFCKRDTTSECPFTKPVHTD